MAETKYSSIKKTDREVLECLNEVVDKIEYLKASRLRISVGGLSEDQTSPSGVIENERFKHLFRGNSSAIDQFTISSTEQGGMSIDVKRNGYVDSITINFGNVKDVSEVSKIVQIVSGIFPSSESKDFIRKTLGNEVATFYEKRDVSLMKLEEISQTLIRDNQKYRRKLDDEISEKKRNLEESVKKLEVSLRDEYSEKSENLQKKEEELKEIKKNIDDRDSRHVRRRIRQELKDRILAADEDFGLSKSTNKKRLIIHIIFVFLIIFLAFLSINYVLRSLSNIESDNIYFQVRLLLVIAGLVAAVIFYIRWNDNWFRQHADEEFRLKQLLLDVDRASWVVEMVMEWKDEKGTEIPKELVDRLTANLFSSESRKVPTHPAEDLASKLLGASSNITMRLPFGDVNLTGRDVRKFQKDSEKSKKSDE